jgi:PAS domain S-box-containing protein
MRTAEVPALKTAFTILIAADERLRRQFSLIFNDSRYAIIEAQTQDEVLQMARTARPDLVLLAENGMWLDAFETCAALRSSGDTGRIPVVLLVQSEDEGLINRALDSGASDYISYPIKASVMRQRVRFLLRMREMQADLLEKEERYRLISTSITDYAYAFRVLPNGHLVKEWHTKAFEVITGYDDEELDLLGGWGALIHPDDRHITAARAERLLRGEKDVSEFRIRTRNGELRWLQDTGLPIWDEAEGRVTWIYGAAQDITARKQAEELMWRTTLQLQARNDELDAFAHTVAHNLKNPIAGMMGSASLALTYFDRMNPDEMKENLQAIIEGAYKARDIIEALLLLAGVNRQSTVEIGPIDMRQVISSVKTRLLPQIQERGARITLSPTFPTAVGYAPWVEEIWSNYLSNALKYGGTPPVITFGADGPRNGAVKFWISDNGKGLTEDEKKMVFTPFTRLSQAKIEGHGLGLSVVQRIVQRLGGVCGVDSKPGDGARFWFTLPDRIAAQS